MLHKWENAFSLDKYSWGYRSEMTTSDVMNITDLIETVVSTISCGGKTKDLLQKGIISKIEH